MRTEFFAPVKAKDFHVTAYVYSNHVEFKCYECTDVSADGIAKFDTKSRLFCDRTTNLEEATVFLSGSIKWDGCANIRFDTQDDLMLHFCGRDDASRVGKLLDMLYEITARLLPTFDERLGA